MSTPQAGIFALGTRTHHHLEFDVDAGASVGEVAAALRALDEPQVTGGASNLVIGFGADLWRRLVNGRSDETPVDLGAFEEIRGSDGHVAVATQHDLWVWIHGTGPDVVLDAAAAVHSALRDVATIGAETSCFVYHDSRDLTGFVDGTENPPPHEAAAVACIPPGRPGAGGSHVIAQRWVHDLDAFDELEVADQERVIGRTKLDSVAIPRPDRPRNAHIMRAELLDDDGEERPIYRRSVPFGDVGERGLYFLGFSSEREIFDGMLSRMFGTADDGVRDHLLDFSRTVAGAYYFAPSVEALGALG